MGSQTHTFDASRSRSAGRPQLLLVEDDEDTRELMALALAAAGFSVQTAGSGREALATLTETEFDLLVTDYDMPEMTGTEMLHLAQERGLVRGARPLIVTAHPSPKGTDGFPIVRKPLDLTRFVGMLRSYHAVGESALTYPGGKTVSQHGSPVAHRSDAARPGEGDSN